MSDPLLEAMVDTLNDHALAEHEGKFFCWCGGWRYPFYNDSDARDEFQEHRASAVYTTVLASGRLLPEDVDCLEMFATFRERPAPPPWQGISGSKGILRSTRHSALRTAKFFGPRAYAASCKIYTYPDGTETRTPWVEIEMPADFIDDTPSFP